MIRIGMVGLGKMGISHLAIVNTHPDVQVAAACDSNSYVTDVLGKYTGLRCYTNMEQMLGAEALDAVFISTPSRLHAAMVEMALQAGLHVFCEKPFVLSVADGEKLVAQAEAKARVTQVGYHYRFVAAFEEAARVVRSGELGRIHHIRAEAYGPVVLRAASSTWRSAKSEGGGALFDYACHALDLVNFVLAPPSDVEGVVLNSIYSRDVDDEIYCSLRFENGASGQLAVNWSDESHRKMSTKLSVWGEHGRLNVDRQECQVYRKGEGWTIRYTTDLTAATWFYLRGEEYSAQVDYFVESVKAGRTDGKNSFRSALETDRVVANILGAAGRPATRGAAAPARVPLLARLRGSR